MIVTTSYRNGLTMELQMYFGFQDFSSHKLSLLELCKTSQESTSLLLTKLHLSIKSWTRQAIMTSKKSLKMGATFTEFICKEQDGIITSITLTILIQKNCSQTYRWCNWYLLLTESLRLKEFTTVHFTRYNPEEVPCQLQVIQLTSLCILSYHQKKLKTHGFVEVSLPSCL